jgi:hypothetical protein
MEKTLSEILNAIPPKPPRSKLEPYYDLIRELRRRSKTYREIAQILEEHVGLRVDHSTIFDFVHVQVRRAKAPRYVDGLPPEVVANGTVPPETEVEPVASSSASAAPDGAPVTYSRIETMKQRKQSANLPDQGFHYEEGAPLRLISDLSKE